MLDEAARRARLGTRSKASSLSVGRHKGFSAVGSTRQLALDSGRSGNWSIVGWAGLLAGFAVLTTYSVIAGQVVAYSVMAFVGEFADGSATNAAGSTPLYSGEGHAVLWHTVGIDARLQFGFNELLRRLSGM